MAPKTTQEQPSMSFKSLKNDLKNPETGEMGLNSSCPAFYEFSYFRLDAAKRLLLRDGVVVPLTPKAFDVLLLLVSRRGHVVGKDELLSRVWPDTIVEENNLNVNVSLLRKVLGEKPSDHTFIVTVPGRGYQFASEVRLEGYEEATRSKVSDSAVSPDLDFLVTDEKEPAVVKVIADEKSRFDGETDSDVRVSILDQEPPSANHFSGQTRGSDIIVPKSVDKRREIGPWISIVIVTIAVVLIWSIIPPGRPLPPMKVVPLTSFLGFETNPSFSPDGNFIAFCWGGEKDDNVDVYVQQIGGTGPPIRLTTDPADDILPVWSPDGTQIAFSRFKAETEKATFIIPAFGGPERKIRSSEVKAFWGGQKQLDWSPDGKFIAAPDKLSDNGPYQILLLSPETLETHQLTFAPDKSLGDLVPQFSPDGQSVAFVRILGGDLLTKDIRIIPVAGGEPRRLTSDNKNIDGLAWTADGREIVFSSNRDGMSKLWRVNASGGTPEPVAIGDFGVSAPAIARKGDRLAFVKRNRDTNIYRLSLGPSARSGEASPKVVPSTQYEGTPNFSPDGKRIAFESERSGQHGIWLCNYDGSDLIPLTSFGTHPGSARWSPDGQQIAFDSGAEESATRDIYLINTQGGAPRLLTPVDNYDDMVPGWSKDGQWVYFTSRRSGDWQVWKVPAVGGEPVQVTKQGGYYLAFEASDGNIYYAKSPTAPGIWRVPVDGGDEVPVLQSVAGYWANWGVAHDGIYYIEPETKKGVVIEFYNFTTRRIAEVASLGKVAVPFFGFAISPDGQSALYTLVDHDGSDIMLVENFR